MADTSSPITRALVATLLMVLALAVIWLLRPSKTTGPARPHEAGETHRMQPMEDARSPEGPVAETPAASGALHTPTAPREVTESSGFADSDIARRWMDDEGYTRDQILEVQAALRSEGMTAEQAEDPGNVRRALPPRHISTLIPQKLEVPEQARAGEPIPFRFEGRTPDPSFQFTRFSILRQEQIIRVRAMGNSDGRVVAEGAGEGATVALDGELPPLPPGDYRVEVVELGPYGSFSLTVE